MSRYFDRNSECGDSSPDLSFIKKFNDLMEERESESSSYAISHYWGETSGSLSRSSSGPPSLTENLSPLSPYELVFPCELVSPSDSECGPSPQSFPHWHDCAKWGSDNSCDEEYGERECQMCGEEIEGPWLRKQSLISRKEEIENDMEECNERMDEYQNDLKEIEEEEIRMKIEAWLIEDRNSLVIRRWKKSYWDQVLLSKKVCTNINETEYRKCAVNWFDGVKVRNGGREAATKTLSSNGENFKNQSTNQINCSKHLLAIGCLNAHLLTGFFFGLHILAYC